ncbi:MAG: carboxypeptidase regulatory-like domain-containing protein [Actinobacteria bacterium]|nr:carboxypeptidase regulatory-like domain-containing protein [Actinomycetota bacterium]
MSTLLAPTVTGDARCRAVQKALRGIEASRAAHASKSVRSTASSRRTANARASRALRTSAALSTSSSLTAADGGSLSGIVTSDQGAAPLAGICVYIDNGTGSTTAADGTYTFTGLATGSYRVHFFDCRPDGVYVAEWYNNASYQNATLVSVTAGQAVTGINAGLALGGAIAGTVVSDTDHAAIADVCVFASNTDFGVGTRPDGTYRLSGIPAGTTTVHFFPCPNTTDSRATQHVGEWYDNVATQQMATPVTVTAGATVGSINASLSTGSTLTGTVTDRASLAPLAGECVNAFTNNGSWTYAYGTTRADGTYTLVLPAGSYVVSFSDCNDLDGYDYLDQYWQDTPSYSAATLVVVPTGGGTASGINAALDRGGRITGTVSNGTAPVANVCVDAYVDGATAQNQYLYASYSYTQPDGTYVMRGVRPGTYIVVFDDCGSGPQQSRAYVSQYYGGTRVLADATRVTVAVNTATAGVNATLVLGGRITGTARDQHSGSAIADICLDAQPRAAQTDPYIYDYSYDQSATDGSFVLGALAGGDYVVEAYDCTYPERYEYQAYDGKTYQDATLINVRLGQSATPITVNMRAYAVGTGSINGRVTVSDGTPVQGAYVQTCTTGGRCSTATTNSTGDYTLTGLVDQEYVVTAYPPSRGLNTGSTRVTVNNGSTGPVQIIVLTAPVPPPSGTTVGTSAPGTTPVVVVGSPSPVTVDAPLCTGGGAVTFVVTSLTTGQTYTGSLTETPAGSGSYSGDIVVPFTGMSDVAITQAGCPDASKIKFNLYVDPSGYVRDQNGAVLPGATVTLYRATGAAGPFTAVPDGSSVMDPGNRTNPDTTDSAGHFGWNVIAGYYKVRATKSGCRSATDRTTSFVESRVYEIPPAVTNVELVLDCGPIQPTYVSVVPERLLDTRAGTSASPIGYVGSKPAAEETVQLQVTGVGSTNLPSNAKAVVLNVTGVDPTASGFVTVWPCGSPMPNASNLNLLAGVNRPNLVVTKVGTGGKVCIYTRRGTHLLADVSGYFPAPSEYVPVLPERLLDTRPGTGQIGYTGDKPAPEATVRLKVTGRGTSALPADASSVVLNVTGTEATASGFVTVWPCGSPMPNASNLNLVSGGTRPNLVVTKVGTNGEVCLFTRRGTHLLADVTGYFPATTDYVSVNPQRLLDTRSGVGYTGVKPDALQTVQLQVTGGSSPVPAGMGTAVLNVTGTEATANGFVTVWPCDQPMPNASNLNLREGETAPNLVISKIDGAGKVCLFTRSGTHLLVDVAGYLPAG